jgi:glycosyltransferase involved in cell wall biosynthesis
MRVLVDLRKWRDTGIGVHCRGLFSHVGKLKGPELELLLLCRSQDAKDLEFLGQPVPLDLPTYHPWENVAIPSLAKKLNAGVYHGTANQAPYWMPCPSVVTVHDLIVFKVPGALSFPKDRIVKACMERSIAQAAAIACVSEATRRECLALGAHESRTHTVHNALNAEFDAAADQPVPPPQLPLSGPYFLFVGLGKPHKNLARVLRAMTILAERWPDGRRMPNLVLVGPQMENIRALTRQLNLDDRVCFTGAVQVAELIGLYRNATALCFPSLNEGFGLPALEAMRVDLPVLTSNCSSLPEVCGDAALYVDPYSEQQIADGLRTITLDDGLRARLKTAGRARLSAFSWEVSARKMVGVYAQAASATK